MLCAGNAAKRMFYLTHFPVTIHVLGEKSPLLLPVEYSKGTDIFFNER